MAKPEKKVVTEVAVTDKVPTSEGTILGKLVGKELKPEEVELLKKKMVTGVHGENLEELFADYLEMIQSWNLKIRGPSIEEIVKHMQAALRGFIPTGDGVVDAALTKIISGVTELKGYTAEQWQKLFNLLIETIHLVPDIRKAPKISQQTYNEACEHIKTATALFKQPSQQLGVEATTQITFEETTPKPSVMGR